MTVKQLIDILKNFDEGLHVAVCVCHEPDDGKEIFKYETHGGDIIDPEQIFLNSDGDLEIRAIDF